MGRPGPAGRFPKPNSMITGTGPLALAGVVNVNSMLTVIAGYAELSTWPTIFLVTTGTSPFFSCVVPVTSQTTLGATLGTRPQTSRSKSSAISGRRLLHQTLADFTFLPFFSTSGSGSFGYGLAFASS